MFKALERFIPYVKLFQHFALLLPNMPGVIPGPEHLSNNALSPPPFVPPAELAEVYPELVDSMQTALYMNFPKPERQLRMLDEAAQFMVRLVIQNDNTPLI